MLDHHAASSVTNVGVILISLSVVLATTNERVTAQQEFGRTCGTMDVDQRLRATVSGYAASRDAIEAFQQSYRNDHRRSGEGARSRQAVIPVVVHVVWNQAVQNIADAQIQSQIDALNRDYRLANADVATAPDVFEALSVDTLVQFALAVRDPNCQATNGITRSNTATASFTWDDAVKFVAGAEAWPADKYLNLWVAPLSGGLLGYAQFPGGPANTDGVVIDYTAFGTQGTAAFPFNLGRTATHEIGHWLDLYHIWGDDCAPDCVCGACFGNDLVDDTPNQGGCRSGCPAFPQISCGNGPDGDMYVNYMDYTDDRCMVMFTTDQSTRIDATLFGARAAILASDGLVPAPGPVAADLWSQDRPTDPGSEPDPIADVMYMSEDIWVRNTDDGIAHQEHMNPLYRPPGTGSDYVYVRVMNRSCNQSGSATLRLYWAKASSGLSWPAPWDGSVVVPALMGGLIDSQATGNIPPRGFQVLTFPWNPPNPDDYAVMGADKSHFCLLSRLETAAAPPFGMTFAETDQINDNVRNNNNIVWKNVHVVTDPADARQGVRQGALSVANPRNIPATMTLSFEAPLKEPFPSALKWGRVFVDLGPDLHAKWVSGGSQGHGIAAGIGGPNSIEVLILPAAIENIVMPANEIDTISVTFSRRIADPAFFAAVLPGAERNRIYSFHVIQREVSPTSRFIGGQRFLLKTVSGPGEIRVPALTSWGLAILVLCLSLAGVSLLIRRRVAPE